MAFLDDFETLKYFLPPLGVQTPEVVATNRKTDFRMAKTLFFWIFSVRI